MSSVSYRRHRFPPVVIQHAVWLYRRFTLSYRDVEELLAERGDVRRPPSRPRRRGGASERKSGSQLTRRRREMDSNLYGAFSVKWSFWFFAGSLFGAGRPFFVPSPAIRLPQGAEGVKDRKR